ncbi:hypothetical protein GP486_005827 [Trichoglossum hirsutum]|uniref:Uncharacterized protein n=1 Tax=Trichoglossum hirsutum TaxID=265104 RepID=A0A9P8L8H5_9PEZI|nr:hypothetical protein GP486_005827 [Trichoglossum hirsutum]
MDLNSECTFSHILDRVPICTLSKRITSFPKVIASPEDPRAAASDSSNISQEREPRDSQLAEVYHPQFGIPGDYPVYRGYFEEACDTQLQPGLSTAQIAHPQFGLPPLEFNSVHAPPGPPGNPGLPESLQKLTLEEGARDDEKARNLKREFKLVDEMYAPLTQDRPT